MINKMNMIKPRRGDTLLTVDVNLRDRIPHHVLSPARTTLLGRIPSVAPAGLEWSGLSHSVGYAFASPRIFAAEKIGADFSTDVVFLLLNRERIVSDCHLRLIKYRSCGTYHEQ